MCCRFFSRFEKSGAAVPQRIAALTGRGEAVDVEVSFAAGENSVTLTGYSAGPPLVSANAGQIVKVSWNSSTNMFELVVAPGANATAQLTISSAAPRRRPACN